jgi:hypothetical protein
MQQKVDAYSNRLKEAGALMQSVYSFSVYVDVCVFISQFDFFSFSFSWFSCLYFHNHLFLFLFFLAR